jgi:hypothetical protein
MISMRTARAVSVCCLLLAAAMVPVSNGASAPAGLDSSTASAAPIVVGDLAQSSPGKTERPALAKRTSAKRRKPAVSFSGNVDLQFIYDDNILRMSQGMIDNFRRGIDPLKFDINTYDDLIVSPRFGGTIGRALIGSRETTLRLLYIRWQYGRNAIKNNESYTIRLRQPIFDKDFIEASYSYSPGSYVKQLSDRPPFAPRSSTALVWLPFKSRRNAFVLGYSRRVTSRLTGRLDAGRVLRFYNRPFLENDNREWNASGNLSFVVSKAVRAAGTYTFSDAKARALDTVGETVASSDDSDGSYERDLYQMDLSWSPRRFPGRISSFGLMGQYQEYYFTSKKPYYDDPLHTGRKDQVYAIEITSDTKPVYGPVKLTAGWRFSQRKSSLPASVQAEDAEEKAYKDNRFWIGASYPFSGTPW